MSDEDADWDVVVVGAGLAGHCAALEAAAAGARPILLEKESQVGGSSVLSAGFFAFANTALQQKHGIADSPELLAADLASVGGPDVDMDLVRAYAFGQGEVYTWLTDRGVTFSAIELSAAQSVPRSHWTDGSAMLAALARTAQASGLTTNCNTEVRRLRRDAGSGRVIGVDCRRDGADFHIRARRGVVLATGGFSRSDDLMRNFAPQQHLALRVGGSGSTGDGLKMAWQLGAGFCDMGSIKGTFGTHPEGGNERLELLLGFYLGAIIVNRDGQRFADESQPYKLLGDACLRQPGAMGFQIYDRAIIEQSQPGVSLFDFAPAIATGKMIRADTIPALAVRCGIDAAALAATVATYNADVDTGRDSRFGRDGLCNHQGSMRRIETPPFYAYPSTSVVLATYCGLTTDTLGRVRDVFGTIIPGLYAAGELTGGFHGSAYMTGSALGKAAYFGRVAGRAAAQETFANEGR